MSENEEEEEQQDMRADPDMPLEEDNKGPENKTPEATEFGQSELDDETKMMRQMSQSDTQFVGEPFQPLKRNMDNQQKEGHNQTSMKNLINFRDHMGRTALHIAAIWKNKVACETLLYLKANCLIEDGAGFKPIDYVDPNSSIADLFKNWMPRTTPPSLFPFGV